MKKFLTLVLAFVACIGTMSAWTPSDTDYTIVDLDSTYNQSGMKTFILDDGTIYHLWQRTPAGVMYNEPTFGYYLHLQIFDPAGNPKFDKEGILVSNKPTQSSTTDYGVAIASNGDIVMAYYDVRDDVTERYSNHIYLYRYDKNGNSVWNADGIQFPVEKVNDNAFRSYELAPQLTISDDNIYLSCVHSEGYSVKADSTNWEPSWWDPDEEMPDSIQVYYYDYRYIRVNADGTFAWDAPIITQSGALDMLAPCANGDVYFLYSNENNGVDAQRINIDGKNVWDQPVTVESEALGSSYVTTPTVFTGNEGDITLVYRVPYGWYGYAAFNHLDANGNTYGTGLSLTGGTDGNCGTYQAAMSEDSLLVAWEYRSSEYNLYANLASIEGSGSLIWPEWPFDHSKGVSYDTNTEWGFKPVKVIHQSDGWVILYGNVQSWNGANFMVLKIDNYGNQLWSKQICNENFKCSGYSVVSDGKYAYIFLIVPQEYDSDWNKIVGDGGMRVMCVDLTELDNPSGVNELNEDTDKTIICRYDLTGRVVTADTKGIQIVKYSDGSARKMLVK